MHRTCYALPACDLLVAIIPGAPRYPFRRCVEDLSQRIGGPDAETRAFQVIATLEGGMMLARAYQDTEVFDQAVAALV